MPDEALETIKRLSGRPSTAVRQAEIVRALRAAKEAGLEVARFEVDQSGKVVVFTTSGGRLSSDQQDLDHELAEFEARHGDG